MTDASGTANWTMATGADDVRAFEMNTTGGLESTALPETQAFNVTVRGSGGNEWRFYVYDNPALPDAEIAVKNGTGALESNVCGGLLPSGPPRVNLTAGTVAGSDCDKLVFAKGTTPPYDIEITYGDRAEGTYNATVNTTNVGTFNGPGPASSPYEVPVVYSLSVDVVYRTPGLEYRARVRLAPGAGT
jgi:hypothetical protein